MGEMKNFGCTIRDDSNAINTKSLLFLSLHGIMQKTKYPGVAQLVARLLWEDRRPIHSPKSESPEALGTVVCGRNFPVEKLP